MADRSLSLGGDWLIAKDENGSGIPEARFSRVPPRGAVRIPIPGDLPQSWNYSSLTYSRVFPGYNGYVWYYRTFSGEGPLPAGHRCLIEFDNAGYLCRIWLNGVFLAEHRQSEQRFEVDATEAFRADGENLLAVQCYEPKIHGEPIEGIRLEDIPNGSLAYGDYDNEPCGGILGEVRLRIVPQVSIGDVYAIPDADSGDVGLEVTLVNRGAGEASVSLQASFFEHKRGTPVTRARETVCVPPGSAVCTLSARIPARKLWSTDSPSLYEAHVRTQDGSERVLRFGFKDFRVRDGYFFLNGKRIFLKSAHCTNSCEVAIGMKATGFNTIRMLTRTADPELLDLCDELGLLVIDAPLTAWGMRDHEQAREQVFAWTEAMVLKSRSHPCLAAYYLFNELRAADGVKRKEGTRLSLNVFRAGVEYLPRLRALDRQHLVLLSSGRWDREIMIGSVSNPGSDEWECVWGLEGEGELPEGSTFPAFVGNKGEIGMGDIHPYVRVPMSADCRRWYRTLAEDSKPVFISEEGWGSQSDPYRRYLELQEDGGSTDSIYARQYRRLCDGLDHFIEDNGFDGIFPFPQDFLYETFRLNERQRQQMFDVIRSNPKICGYSLTSWCNANEGPLEGRYVLKPGLAHALQEGWAPLRWALFTSERAVYAGRPFEIEAVLCNEDFLRPGRYPAVARIKGPEGIAWEKRFDAVYPEDGPAGLPPLAATVLKETVSLPEGTYTFAVRLLEGGAPFGGNLPLSVLEPRAETLPDGIACVCTEENTARFLSRHGIGQTAPDGSSAPGVVLVGAVPREGSDAVWSLLCRCAQAGSTVIFLRSESFLGRRDEPVRPLTDIAGADARCVPQSDWLYHMDYIHKDCELFDRLPRSPVCDPETYDLVYPSTLFLDMAPADRVLCAGIGLNCFIENNCARSLTLAEYRCGAGRFVLNAFRIEEMLGRHPIADQLLLNLLSFYGQGS